jgi:hypothetical protein
VIVRSSSPQSAVSLVFHQPALVHGQLRDTGPPGNVSYLESLVHWCYVTQGSKLFDQRRIRCLAAPAWREA